MDSHLIAKLCLRPYVRCTSRTQVRLTLKVFIFVMLLYIGVQSATFAIERTRNYRHDVRQWTARQTVLCGGNFTGYGRKFFRMKSVLYVPQTDSFHINCRNEQLPPAYSLTDHDYGVGKYIKRINHVTGLPTGELKRQNHVTVIVDRCNSHNYYHAMQEWYNLFLISKFFKIRYKTLQIFLIDRSPEFHNDIYWKMFFPTLLKVKDLNSTILFDDAIFNPPGSGNPMEFWELNELPYIEEFSRTILSYFYLRSDKHLDCRNLTITLIIRRDYYLHPESDVLQKRNAQRKFKNEDELVKTLRQKYSSHTIRLFVAEDMTLKDQLELAIQTDIFVGMHGCVLTNTLFMPKHGAIFEMYPKYWDIKNFFSALARWRGIEYGYWRNEEAENEYPNYYTLVPPEVLVDNVEKMRQSIGC